MEGSSSFYFSNGSPLVEKSVAELFERSVQRYKDRPFLSNKNNTGQFVDISYGEFGQQVLALRAIYQQAGYTVGHRVGLLVNNNRHFHKHFLALNGLGVSVVPLNPDALPLETVYLVTNSELDLIVTIEQHKEKLHQILNLLENTVVSYISEKFPAQIAQARSVSGSLSIQHSTEAAILYTSGTTGKPKGCILTNEYFLAMGAIYTGWGGLLQIEDGNERLLNPLPLFHINHLVLTTVSMIATGGCNILVDRFSASKWWQDCIDSKATIIHYLGVVPAILLALPDNGLEQQHQVKFGVGAGVDPKHHAAFEVRFNIPLLELWGMTETGAGFIDSTNPRSVGTRAFGRPQGPVRAKVVDQNMRRVEPGVHGQLLVQSGTSNPRFGFFAGYLKNQQDTEASWHEDWFCTGDIVYQDESGMLYFVDRLKNIIRRSGENISAGEVESCLYQHPDIEQVVVMPVPDPIREEEVLACIQLKDGVVADADRAAAIHAWAMERLSYYKTPGYISFISEIPTTGTQKIQKNLIFEEGVNPLVLPTTFNMCELKKRSNQ